jgi:hypothetical protein
MLMTDTSISKLCGMRLLNVCRVSSIFFFRFSSLGDDNPAISVHVQCSWRIRNEKLLLVGFRDILVDLKPVKSHFDLKISEHTLCDKKLASIMKKYRNTLLVDSAASDIYGGLLIKFKRNITLEVFPDSVDADNEHWRLMHPKKTSPLIVMSGVSCRSGGRTKKLSEFSIENSVAPKRDARPPENREYSPLQSSKPRKKPHGRKS